MAKGGYRAGAGRPRGSRTVSGDVKAEARKAKVSPLAYMLRVMNDPKADKVRRDRMAIAAAPFVHPRVADQAAGKKGKAQADAETAGRGTAWGEDLETPETPTGRAN